MGRAAAEIDNDPPTGRAEAADLNVVVFADIVDSDPPAGRATAEGLNVVVVFADIVDSDPPAARGAAAWAWWWCTACFCDDNEPAGRCAAGRA